MESFGTWLSRFQLLEKHTSQRMFKVLVTLEDATLSQREMRSTLIRLNHTIWGQSAPESYFQALKLLSDEAQ